MVFRRVSRQFLSAERSLLQKLPSGASRHLQPLPAESRAKFDDEPFMFTVHMECSAELNRVHCT